MLLAAKLAGTKARKIDNTVVGPMVEVVVACIDDSHLSDPESVVCLERRMGSHVPGQPRDSPASDPDETSAACARVRRPAAASHGNLNGIRTRTTGLPMRESGRELRHG